MMIGTFIVLPKNSQNELYHRMTRAEAEALADMAAEMSVGEEASSTNDPGPQSGRRSADPGLEDFGFDGSDGFED